MHSLEVNLILGMLNLNMPCYENSVDPDQLASEKPACQDPHCFQLCNSHCLNACASIKRPCNSACTYMLLTGIKHVNWIKREECRHEIFSLRKAKT